MLSENLRQIAVRAKLLYQEHLHTSLEANHMGDFVCIEPDSGEYFVGRTFDDAVNQAIDAFPDRLTHTLRVGHEAAFHIGVICK